jgi:signal transduction histidine kinase
MNLFALSGLLITISSLFFGSFVFLKNTKNTVNRLWTLFSITVAIWGLAAFIIGQLPPEARALALLWWRIAYLGIIFIPVLFYHFVHAWLGLKERIFLHLFYSWGLFFSILEWTPWGDLFFGYDNMKLVFSSFYVVGPKPLFNFFVLCWFSIIIYSHYKLYTAFRTATGLKKDQIKYFFLGIAIAFLGGGSSFSMCFGARIYPYYNFAVPLYPAIMSYAILKYRLMDIRVVFTRAGIFLAVYTIVLGIPFIVLSRTGSGLLATSLAVVFASAGPVIYRFLQRKAEAIVLAKQLSYQRILLQAATTMITEHDLLKLSRLIVFILKKTIKLRFTAIFVKDKRLKTYPLKAMRGAASAKMPDASLDEGHPFIRYLEENKEPFLSEEMPLHIKDSLNLPVELRIVIPAFAEDELLAFVLLGDKVNAEHYTQEDIDVFKILARQATLAIQNCEFFEESKEYQQRVFSAEKLASIGGMADGLAHQIKNRLNQFSLASGELKSEIADFSAKHNRLIKSDKELGKTFKYLGELADSLLDNVKRTDGIIKGILDFARVENKESFFACFSLKEVISLSTNLLMMKHRLAEFPLTVNISGNDKIYGIKSQLTEAIYNLLDNAYEATKEKKAQLKNKEAEDFIPAIELHLAHKHDRHAIRISDNGIGIKEEDRLKIFAPFFTTKTTYKSGSGIGAYVVKRIIEENHNGKIWFTSNYMEGTEFFIELPNNLQ